MGYDQQMHCAAGFDRVLRDIFPEIGSKNMPHNFLTLIFMEIKK